MVNFWGQEVKDQCQTTPQLDLETRWRHYSRPIWSTSFLILLVAKILYWDIVYLFLLVVGRVPGDYPVPAGYCTVLALDLEGVHDLKLHHPSSSVATSNQ